MQEDRDTNEHHRHLALLHAYLRQRLDRPRRIEPLAMRVFEQLHTVGARELACDPLSRLCQIAIRVLCQEARDARHSASPHPGAVKQEHGARDESDTAVSDTRLQQHLGRALLTLPPTHAALLVAHKRDGLSLAQTRERFGLDLYLVQTYISQAKALIRMLEWDAGEEPAHPMHHATERTLLTAQQAAGWLVRVPTASEAERAELVDWLRQRVPHVREILLALAWDDALLQALHHRSSIDSRTLQGPAAVP